MKLIVFDKSEDLKVIEWQISAAVYSLIIELEKTVVDSIFKKFLGYFYHFTYYRKGMLNNILVLC